MKKFTHGIIAVDPEDVDENDELLIVHFIGLWQEPTQEEFEVYEKEIRTNPKYGHVLMAERLVVMLAPPHIVEKYFNMANEHEISKLN